MNSGPIGVEERAVGARRSCVLVEFSIMPQMGYSLAMAYLRASVEADPEVGAQWSLSDHVVFQDVEDDTAVERFVDTLDSPDVVAFSVYFWNRQFSEQCATLIRSRWPDTVLVFGGNDVTDQAEQVFRGCPAVDIVVHGEGELTFPELLEAIYDGANLSTVQGISFRGDIGAVTTAPRPRIENLDLIPSPFLTGVIRPEQLAGTSMVVYETNRGCPYSCAFCYWGGATNSKVRQFSTERVLAELDYILTHCKDNTALFIADANFGIFGRDLDIAQELVRLSREHHKRLIVMTNWAKNSSSKVVEIASVLYDAGLTGAVTLSAQSFDAGTLEIAHRKNIKVSRYRSLQSEFIDRNIPTYTDLLWGLPGESLDVHVAGIEECLTSGGSPVIYPLLLLNNTEYTAARFRDDFAMRTRRLPSDMSNPHLLGDVVVAHSRMTEDDWMEGIRIRFALGVFWKCCYRATISYLNTAGGVEHTAILRRLADELFVNGLGDKVISALIADYLSMFSTPGFEGLQRAHDIIGASGIVEELHYQAVVKRLVFGAGGKDARDVAERVLRSIGREHGVCEVDISACLGADHAAMATIRSTIPRTEPDRRPRHLPAHITGALRGRGVLAMVAGTADTDVLVTATDCGRTFSFSSYAVSIWHGSSNPLRDCDVRDSLAKEIGA
ncbi:B12-binding domain-containing radical SAM protein [Rudaeicoccus suwonensis]|uniref:Radical SAM family protein n=1 Tax=Rudaeicoccus suwonensis TaxID=657409 RepID=A0A561ECQ0_9MICO|nr:cobalamin-dependent protein [Rudaeicoccus suwonensis]TWE13398.1 radical SAM family protein [Rudaeicoccus suwonensis]